MKAMVLKEVKREFVHKFFAIVGLDRVDKQLKLRENKSTKRNKCVANIELLVEGKSPTKMRKIIDNNKIIMIDRCA